MEKEDFRTISEATRLNLRNKAMRLVLSKKYKKSEVAHMLGVRPATITAWVKVHNMNGFEGLKAKPKGNKSADMLLLSASVQKSIQAMIVDKMPDQLKLNYALWTRKAVKELVENEFGIILAINTMGDYLRSWGYSPQKPKKQAYEQCDKKVQKWLDEDYPAIEERAKQEGAEIHWGDETGARNDCQHGRSYAPKGNTPVKKSMSKRFSVNMISTVTNQGKVEFMIYSGNMNADVLILFLTQLTKTKERKTFLILDNLRVHHSNVVKEWLVGKEAKIELFFLPAYSPQRNPDEYLNCDLKQGLSAVPAPKTKEKLQENVENHMNMLAQNSDRVRNYFRHKDIQYAA